MSSSESFSTWPVIIRNSTELPSVFQRMTSRETNESWPYCIYIPKYYTNSLKPNNDNSETVIMLLENNVSIGVLSRGILKKTEINYKSIQFLKKEITLLYGMLDLTYLKRGNFESISFNFNTAQEELFVPIIERIRKENTGINLYKTKKNFDIEYLSLKNDNLKFFNYSNTVFKNSSPIHTIFQPRVIIDVNGISSSTIVDTKVLHMTDNELIVIEEPNSILQNTQKHGGTWTYIPLSKVSEIELEHDEEFELEVTKLNIILSNNFSYSIDFAEDKEIELYKITTEFDTLKRMEHIS